MVMAQRMSSWQDMAALQLRLAQTKGDSRPLALVMGYRENQKIQSMSFYGSVVIQNIIGTQTDAMCDMNFCMSVTDCVYKSVCMYHGREW